MAVCVAGDGCAGGCEAHDCDGAETLCAERFRDLADAGEVSNAMCRGCGGSGGGMIAGHECGSKETCGCGC